MKTKSNKATKQRVSSVAFQPGIVTFLIAVVAVLSLLLFAYFGVAFSA